MTKIRFGLIGAGGSGREVMPYARASVAQTLAISPEDVSVYFVETLEPTENQINGHPLISLDTFLNFDGPKYFNIALGDGKKRAVLAKEIQGLAEIIHIHSPQAIFLENNLIAEGAIFCPNSMVTSNVKIGRFFHANVYAHIAHDCIIGDYVTFAPGARCNGRVVIGDYTHIGANAVIREGTSSKPLKIGKGVVVGIGAVVTKDIPDGITVVGNPARPLSKSKS
jgi:sugar O-acyltransferase (sialic acid O-acetyltransferase NeuD family)